jgi:hypothetical protein
MIFFPIDKALTDTIKRDLDARRAGVAEEAAAET